MPLIVVHTDRAATDTHDGRVQIGGIRVSMAGWGAVPTPDGRVVNMRPLRADGVIEVPDNTLGPGEPLWIIRDRQNAERNILESVADQERARAERAANRAVWDRPYGFLDAGFSVGWHGRFSGPFGAVTPSIDRFDDLGSSAQRAYFDAAYPRLNGSMDGRDRAVRQFGRDATPPINRIQEDIDRAHNNASKEHVPPSR